MHTGDALTDTLTRPPPLSLARRRRAKKICAPQARENSRGACSPAEHRLGRHRHRRLRLADDEEEQLHEHETPSSGTEVSRRHGCARLGGRMRSAAAANRPRILYSRRWPRIPAARRPPGASVAQRLPPRPEDGRPWSRRRCGRSANISTRTKPGTEQGRGVLVRDGHGFDANDRVNFAGKKRGVRVTG